MEREKDHIDILIRSEANGWTFVIENKVHSRQHGNQLARYLDRTSKQRVQGDQQVFGIFLTLNDELPDDDRYVSINYKTVCDVLRLLVRGTDQNRASRSQDFVLHYLEILEDMTGMSSAEEELQALARSMYREHKKALDYIFEHGASTDFSIAVDNTFGVNLKKFDTLEIDQQKFVFVKLSSKKQQLQFVPNAWFTALGKGVRVWEGCENWSAGLPLTCWIELRERSNGEEGDLSVTAEVGPLKNGGARVELVNAIKEKVQTGRVSFRNGASDPTAQYSRFFKQNSTRIKDMQSSEEIETAIQEPLKRFKPEFALIAEVLVSFQQIDEQE